MSEIRANGPFGARAARPTLGWIQLLQSRISVSSGDEDRFRRQLLDYAEIGQRLFWQRQMIFGVALLLAGFYYSVPLAVLNLILVIVSEVYDNWVFRSIVNAGNRNAPLGRKYYWAIVLGTISSAGTISFFAIWITILQGQGSHFMPLFFLFAAGVFAAMNNHHLLSILALRLCIYGFTFLAIPIGDIVQTGADIRSELWVQFFSSVFVAYFIVDCSRIFLSMYRTNLDRLQELEAQNQKIEAALAAKSAFLSTMSHELRTPLTSIRASLDLALSEKLGGMDDGPKKVLDIARRNSDSLKALIDELLDLQKASSGHMQLNYQETNLVTLVQEAVDVNQPYAQKFGCQLVYERPPGPILADLDAHRIKQVLSNLLSNAVKFSPQGSEVSIRLFLNAGKVTIQVRDHGPGLDEAVKEKVFEPFTQLDSGDDRKAGGTGLGLSITKQIVDAHHGQIDYHSEPGKGTTFSVSFPAKLAAAA